jgi:hypothetical protein
MRKLYIYTLAVLMLASISGCKKFLDQVPDDRLTFEEGFSRLATVDRFLANVYSSLPDEARQRDVGVDNAGPWGGASDEINTNGGNFANNLNTGNWDPTSGPVNTFWQNYYRGIQAASNFMANIDRCTDCNLNGNDFITRYKNEARGLRAIYYYMLLRQYGPIVLIGNDPVSADAPITDISKPRSTFDQCVDYIAAELDAASAGLPDIPQSSVDYGHVNKAVLQAYKVQLLLTAASPLFNGNSDLASLRNQDGTQLINQTYSATKWTKAADAAKRFITSYPSYSLFKKAGASPFETAFLSCRDVMLTDWNSEIIFARGNANISYLQYDIAPNHSNGTGGNKGGSFRAASQQIVEAYFMANGLATDDPQSGYSRVGFTNFRAIDDNAERSVSNMYVNREPRFYVGITYTNRKWINPNANIITDFTWNGNAGRAGIGNDDYSSTGYTQRKNLSTSGWQETGRTNVVIRLAEIYLDYIEALFESNPSDPDVLRYLNMIRERAGIPQYGSGAGALPIPSDMREAIRKERRVELAFESHRYFDTRRWKIAETTDRALFGLDITKNANNGFYNVIQLEARIFTARHYLWPIPNGEIQRVPLLVQNPGW